MEKARRGRENIYRNKLMSSNDHVRNWFLCEKQMKENTAMQDPRLEETRKERRSHVKNPETYKILKTKREKQEEKLRSKLSKKDLIYLELKPFMRTKMAKESTGAQPEMKKHRKPTGKSKTKETKISRPEPETTNLPNEKFPSFHNTWEYTNYSVVPTLSANRTKDQTKKREHKRKHSDRVKRKIEPVQLSEMKMIDNQKNMEVILGGTNKKSKKFEVLYSPFKDFVTDRPNYMNESGGEAVVIYRRHNRKNYLPPHTGDGYQFEQISFSGSCETTVDLVQSKRSLSEPRQNSTKEFYVARRRTRFQLEPHKRTSTQSDFHSAIDFLKQSSGSVEFQNFGEMNSSITRFIYKNPSSHDCRKWQEKKNARHSNQPTVKKSKSSTDSSAIVKRRLKQMAEKKLDLHREMIREEEMSKKKFWESIERSLNYRCAVAEMFSSQSYLSSNESSRFFRSTENPSVRSTNIYVRESVIEKISSYQGFRRYFTSNHSDFQKNTNLKNINQPSNPAFSQMKAVLDTFLIKEDEEEIFMKQDLEDSCTSKSSSDSMVQTDVSPYDLNDSIFSFSASENFNLMESNLCTSDTHSKLELLMSKLSEEIRKCSNFIKKFNEPMARKTVKCSSAKLSASDSKIELNRNVKNKINKKKSFISCGWPTSEQKVCPVLVYSAGNNSLDNFYDTFYNKQKIPKQRKSQKGDDDDDVDDDYEKEVSRQESNSLDPTVLKNINDQEKTESNQSIRSYKNNSLTFTEEMMQPSHSTKKLQSKTKEFPCCDDCILLKKRIIRLEKELGKIEKKMPLYPKEYQESIKNCLQNLNGTSETFLKRLKSCAKLRYLDIKSRKKCKNDSKRSTSSPGPIIEESTKKVLSLRPSNSDYQLNVGMEITMENVDPVTGKKLHPETKKDIEQEGNIQCRMFRSGEKPVLMIDTDFSYNPSTGMLFKSKGSHSSENPATDYIIPMDSVIKKAPSATDLVRTFAKPLQAYECQKIDAHPIRDEFVLPKKPKTSQRDVSTQGSSCPIADVESNSGVLLDEESRSKENAAANSKATGTSPRSTGSFTDVWDSNEVRPESRESKKEMKISWFGWKKNEKPEKSFSRIPVRRKPTPSSASSKADLVSPKSSLMSFITVPPLSECCLSPSDTSRIFFKLAKLFSFTWTFGFFLCKLVHYMQSVSAICSVLTLTAMSLERYYAIVHPMRAQYICTISQARRIITAIWISAFLLAVPILFAQVHLKVGVKVEAYWCVRDWDNKIIWRAHELYMMLLILVVPTAIMAVAYTAICLEIWQVIQRRQNMTCGKGHSFCKKPRLPKSSSNDSFTSSVYNNVRLDNKRRSRGLVKKEMADDGTSVKQVIKMLVAVVVIYVICWGPMLIDNVLQAYGILSHIRIGRLKHMGTTFHLMAYFNSCINPIIYGFMSKNFRESFRKTLCCVRNKPKTVYRSFSLSQTRNTSIRYAESSFSRTVPIALPV